MASLIPAFVTAMQDPALRGNAREVYVWFHEHLDVVDYRPVKHSVIEHGLAMKDSSVADAIGRLLANGYVKRGNRDGQLWTYRLVYSVEMRKSA
jgi:hypothetical protein